MSCLIKVTSGNFQDHFSSLWLYYYYSIKYLARVANVGADRKLKNKTTKAILHGGFQPAGQLFMGSYPALFIKLSSSLLTMVVLPWSFTSRLEDGLRAAGRPGRGCLRGGRRCWGLCRSGWGVLPGKRGERWCTGGERGFAPELLRVSQRCSEGCLCPSEAFSVRVPAGASPVPRGCRWVTRPVTAVMGRGEVQRLPVFFRL